MKGNRKVPSEMKDQVNIEGFKIGSWPSFPKENFTVDTNMGVPWEDEGMKAYIGISRNNSSSYLFYFFYVFLNLVFQSLRGEVGLLLA